MYIRFETPDGEGIFALAGRACDAVRARRARTRRGLLRDLEHLYDWLSRSTPAPPAAAYADPLCRRPTTWFREGAAEHVAQAWRLCVVLNKLGYRVRPVRSSSPGAVLWGDEVQVVVRHHRGEGGDARPRRRAQRPEGACPAAWDGDRTTIRRWSARARRRAGMKLLSGGATLASFERALELGAPRRRGRRSRGRWVTAQQG